MKITILVTGSIPLNAGLLKYVRNAKYPELKSLKLDPVRSFLKDHLDWRVQLPGGEIYTEEVQDLKIGVSYVVAEAPSSVEELPEYSKPENLHDVAKGHHNGIDDGEV